MYRSSSTRIFGVKVNFTSFHSFANGGCATIPGQILYRIARLAQQDNHHLAKQQLLIELFRANLNRLGLHNTLADQKIVGNIINTLFVTIRQDAISTDINTGVEGDHGLVVQVLPEIVEQISDRWIGIEHRLAHHWGGMIEGEEG